MIALITYADHPCGLGTARALKGLGIKIIGISSNVNSRFCRSRIWDQIVPIDGSTAHYLEILMNVGRTMGINKAVLFPIQDDVVSLVSDHRDELKKYYNFVFPDKSAVDLLMNKTTFHSWALEKGFPVPESYIACSKSELNSILDTIKYPVIIKPLVRTIKWDIISPVNKVLRLYKKNDLKDIGFDLFQAAPKLLIQQWIPGKDSNVHFCLMYMDRKGNELGHYTGRKLAQWPVDCGSTAACVGTFNHDVYKLTTQVLQAANFVGLGSLELKQSAEDNKYYIVEPTVGRNDLQSYVAVAGGINLTKMAFYDALKINKKISNRLGCKATWMEEACVIELVKRSFQKKEKRCWEILSGMDGKLSFSHFNIKDPMPFVHLLKEILNSKLKKYLK